MLEFFFGIVIAYILVGLFTLRLMLKHDNAVGANFSHLTIIEYVVIVLSWPVGWHVIVEDLIEENLK